MPGRAAPRAAPPGAARPGGRAGARPRSRGPGRAPRRPRTTGGLPRRRPRRGARGSGGRRRRGPSAGVGAELDRARCPPPGNGREVAERLVGRQRARRPGRRRAATRRPSGPGRRGAPASAAPPAGRARSPRARPGRRAGCPARPGTAATGMSTGGVRGESQRGAIRACSRMRRISSSGAASTTPRANRRPRGSSMPSSPRSVTSANSPTLRDLAVQREQPAPEQVEERRARVGHEEAAVAGAAQQQRRVAAGRCSRDRAATAPATIAVERSGRDRRASGRDSAPGAPLRAARASTRCTNGALGLGRLALDEARAQLVAARVGGLEERPRRVGIADAGRRRARARARAGPRARRCARRGSSTCSETSRCATRRCSISGSASSRITRCAGPSDSRPDSANGSRSSGGRLREARPPRPASRAGPRARGRSPRPAPRGELPEHQHIRALRGHGASPVPPDRRRRPLSAATLARTIGACRPRRRGDQRSHPDPQRANADRARARLHARSRGRADRRRRRFERRHGRRPRASCGPRRCSRRCPAGRTRWTRATARRAGAVVLFLHADTRLEPGWSEAVERALEDPGVAGGAFRLRFDEPRASAMRLIELGVALRARFGGLPYGDQALFVRKRVLDQAGGISPVPIFEDLDLVRRSSARAGSRCCGSACSPRRAATRATACCASRAQQHRARGLPPGPGARPDRALVPSAAGRVTSSCRAASTVW